MAANLRCGNGIRCMARFIYDVIEKQPAGLKRLTRSTLAGEIIPVMKSDGRIEVDMGIPILESKDVPTTLAATQQLKEGNAAVNSPVTVEGLSTRCGGLHGQSAWDHLHGQCGCHEAHSFRDHRPHYESHLSSLRR